MKANLGLLFVWPLMTDFTVCFENSVKPDQLVSPADLDLHCFQKAKYMYLVFTLFSKEYTVKPVLRINSKRRPKIGFKTNYSLMQVKSIAECSNGSILQYFRPSLSYRVIKIFVLSIFEWPLKTGFTIFIISAW